MQLRHVLGRQLRTPERDVGHDRRCALRVLAKHHDAQRDHRARRRLCARSLSLCFTSSYGRDTTGKSSAFRLSQRALHLCAHTDGLWFGPGVRDASFVGGRVLDLAAGGVRVGEGVGYLQEANMPRNSQTCCPRSDHSTALPLTGCSVVSRPRTGRCSM